MSLFGFIDSGIGGLSILNAVKAHLPQSQCVYLADHQYAPYGEKSSHWLNERLHLLCDYLIAQYTPDVIVIACNTASTTALSHLREQFDIPIVGVVPAIKQAAQHSHNQYIGLLATPATCQGAYSDKLISEFATGHAITKIGTTELVHMAEKKILGHDVDLLALQNIIQPFMDNNCDTVVLGCTHFPHLRAELETLAPHIQWIDSSQAIAKRCAYILEQLTPKHYAHQKTSTYLSTSPIPEAMQAILGQYDFKASHTITELTQHAIA